ncbi:unnamed protein product [Macrosiphum euphorbiae]|nr:unnamed protein product [Macrosiphum euphorbiae]
MIHGPCGELNVNSPCMKQGKCKCNYPRALINETRTNSKGYPLYRRRSITDGGFKTTIKMRMMNGKYKPVDVDNSWIVPYSPLVSKIMKAHINLESCSSVVAIKYILKYIHKGSDQAMFTIENKKDEIEDYQSGRYINSNEAIWRILGFPIHDRYPSIFHLSVHLENGQRVYFSDENIEKKAQQPPETTLTAYFKLCTIDNFAKTLFYYDVAKYYTWDNSSKKFNTRRQGSPVNGYPNIYKTDTIGRMYTIHPNNPE